LLSSAMPLTPSKRVSDLDMRVDYSAVTGCSLHGSGRNTRTDNPAAVNGRHGEVLSRPDSLPKLHVQLQR
jgi:hypothetical protein